MLESLFNKVGGRKASIYLKKTSALRFLMNIAKFFDSKAPVLNLKQCGMISTKNGRSCHSTCYLHIISRTHSSTHLLTNVQKRKTCPK